jgi:hypothetical protein
MAGQLRPHSVFNLNDHAPLRIRVASLDKYSIREEVTLQ